MPTVGDEGELPGQPADPVHPERAAHLETLTIIAPYALAMALVGLLESLMTAKLVDDITDTRSRKTREPLGQGGANIALGPLRRHGRLRDDRPDDDQREGLRRPHPDLDVPAGVFLLVLVVGLGDVVAIIPMAALVAVMIMVSVGTFDWHSIRPSTLRRMPVGETVVMVLTVVVVVRDRQPRHRRHRRRRRRDDRLRPPGRALRERRALDRDGLPTGDAAPPSTGRSASCSSPRATTSPRSSTTPTTPTGSSST